MKPKMCPTAVVLPKSRFLKPEDFESARDWRSALYNLTTLLIDEVARAMTELDKPSSLAHALNEILAPFNIYDYRDGAAEYLVAVPSSVMKRRDDEEGLQIHVFYDGELDLDQSDDQVEIVHNGKYWWFTDQDFTENWHVEDIHEELAAQCLEIVSWGDPDLMGSTTTPDELDEMVRKSLEEAE